MANILFLRKFVVCKQRSERVVTLMGNDETKENDLKITIGDGDSAPRQF